MGSEMCIRDRWCAAKGMPVMAYSPLEQGRLAGSAALVALANKYGVTELQIALAWVLHQDDVIAIPKASQIDHMRANRAAHDLTLDNDDLAALDTAFPPPYRKEPLAIL